MKMLPNVRFGCIIIIIIIGISIGIILV